MKALIDLLPVALFVIAYQMYDIYTATAVLMVAVAAQIILLALFKKPIEKMHWITLVLVAVFGGLTLSMRDPLFIMWKPTVINWALAIAFLGSELLMDQGILRRMMKAAGDFPSFVLRRLNYAWVLFFIFLGASNLYVAFNYSEETWVNFKLFGLMGFTFVFIIGQGFYLARYMTEEETVPENINKDS